MWSLILEPHYHFIEETQRYKQLGEGEGIEFWEKKPITPIIHNEIKYRNLLLKNIKEDLVIIGIKDHLTSGNFNPWKQDLPGPIYSLQGLFENFNNKKFILFTSMENLESYLKFDNLHIIPWGGDITNQMSEYKNLKPIIDKDLSSSFTFLSLNRGYRHPRAVLISLLFGLGLETNGMISCMFKNNVFNSIEDIEWPFSSEQKKILKKGLQKFKKTNLLINDDIDIYQNNDNNNVRNFENKLSRYYQQTFVEIINETSYTEKAFNLTEKTLNSIYGCNFPIFLSSKGTVSFLRNIGMDVFDDIINHSYDLIEDPIDRMFLAISDNRELLSNNNKTKELWNFNKERFLKNVSFAKNDIYNFYKDRAETEFLKVLKDL
jgi:hypothetical protein